MAEPQSRTRWFTHDASWQPDFRVWVAILRTHGWALTEDEAQLSESKQPAYKFVATKERPSWPRQAQYRVLVRAKEWGDRWHFRIEGEDGWSERGATEGRTDLAILAAAARCLEHRGMIYGEYDLTLKRE